MSWHDNHVHGLVIRPGDHGTGELTVDLDYILDWLCTRDRQVGFSIAPAMLTFHEVSDLTRSLDYATASAALTPFSIHGITREPSVFPNGHTTHRWRIEVNWPTGLITFLAEGFVQVLRATPRETSEQYLQPSERSTPGSNV
jgi:hypothetical protein